jgi:hypothetical protein
MTEPLKIALAEAKVDRTKAQLIETINELAEELAPRKLVREAWESAKMKGADLAEDAVDAVKKRPAAVGGVVAALTMFLAREPIKDAAVKFYDAMTSKDEPDPAPAALKQQEKPAPPPARRRPRKAATQPRKKTEKAK